MKMRLKTCLLLAITCLTLGQGIALARSYELSSLEGANGVDPPHPEIQRLIDHGKELLGKRYRSRAGGFTLDCSGFVSYAFSKLNIKLPRSSSSMSGFTQSLKKEEVRPGDLLFFKGRNARSRRVGHVALVVDVKGKDIMMIHSSNSKGIIIEPYDSPYYAKRYVGAGRVPELSRLVEAP